MTKTIGIGVDGRSMGKSLQGKVRIQVRQSKQPKTGDIVAFFDQTNRIVVHRYFKLGKAVKTKGDTNKYFDPYPIKKLLGVVVLKEPFCRKQIIKIQLAILFIKDRLKLK